MIAYNYQELIDELKDEIGDGILKKSDIIQVLRAEEAIKDGYYPIIDWHYNKEMMAIDLGPDPSDTKDDIQEKKIIKDQYTQDGPLLKDMTVEDVLAEMFERATA